MKRYDLMKILLNVIGDVSQRHQIVIFIWILLEISLKKITLC